MTDQQWSEYLEGMEKHLETMEEAIAGMEVEGYPEKAEFYKAHLAGVKQVVVLGLTFKNMPDGEEKDQVRADLIELCAALQQSLQVLGDNGSSHPA